MAGVTASIMLGLAGYQAFKSITDKGPQAPTLPPPPPPVDTAAVLAPRRTNRGNGSGRDPSLLTGPLGVTSPAPTTRKSLLGS